jgi:hypothetical protein
MSKEVTRQNNFFLKLHEHEDHKVVSQVIGATVTQDPRRDLQDEKTNLHRYLGKRQEIEFVLCLIPHHAMTVYVGV